MSYTEQIQRIVRRYREAGEKWPASSVDVATWAITKDLWQLHPAALIRQCADQIAQIWRDEFITDPQGRRVRAKHAARYTQNGEQQWLWDDMRTASHRHMELSFQNKRQQIVMDCHQLKQDVDSYNDNFNTGRQIPMVFDFRNDLEELDFGSRGRPAA
jgi:acetone carboxylase gamma subunit